MLMVITHSVCELSDTVPEAQCTQVCKADEGLHFTEFNSLREDKQPGSQQITSTHFGPMSAMA